MNKRLANTIFLLLTVSFVCNDVQTNDVYSSDFRVNYTSIRGDIKNEMEKYTWSEECPVNLADLILLEISYWGFDNKEHAGKIIVHRVASPEVILIFKELYDNKFPINKIAPMHEYYGNDERSMRDNNTSAFNCRPKTNALNGYSMHSYGAAIDINPLINPYIKDGEVIPATAANNVRRDTELKGIIKNNNICYKTFKEKGWGWGGDWESLKDYQHFEKDLSKYKNENKYSLKIHNLPKNSNVLIMNIIKPYSSNKILTRGLYDIRISIPDAAEKRFWVQIDGENIILDYNKL